MRRLMLEFSAVLCTREMLARSSAESPAVVMVKVVVLGVGSDDHTVDVLATSFVYHPTVVHTARSQADWAWTTVLIATGHETASTSSAPLRMIDMLAPIRWSARPIFLSVSGWFVE